MAAALRSLFTASIAVAGVGALAVTPVTVSADLQGPRLETAAVQLANGAIPALGAIPYQIGINQLGNLLALAPVLIGGVEQCEACLGPVAKPNLPATPYTGFGTIGILAGLLGSPIVFIQQLVDTSDPGLALGQAALALQTPITNTLLDLSAPRSIGGYNLEATVGRATNALNVAVNGLLDIGNELLITLPVSLIGGLVTGLQTFAATLAATGNVIDALEAGVVPIRTGIEIGIEGLVASVQGARVDLYSALTSNVPSLAAAEAPAPAATLRAEPESAPAAVAVAPPAVTDAPDPAAVRTAASTPRPAAVQITAVSEAARDAVSEDLPATGRGAKAATSREAAEPTGRVGTTVKAAASGPKRAKAASAR